MPSRKTAKTENPQCRALTPRQQWRVETYQRLLNSGFPQAGIVEHIFEMEKQGFGPGSGLPAGGARPAKMKRARKGRR